MNDRSLINKTRIKWCANFITLGKAFTNISLEKWMIYRMKTNAKFNISLLWCVGVSIQWFIGTLVLLVWI